ncbi:MAG: ACT domain-containing protein [Solirubrobacterales bacterium]|nr:ACT domain-containing protein [Solirubrobacterales bacterium]
MSKYPPHAGRGGFRHHADEGVRDAVATRAADDGLLAVLAKLDQHRGASRFTTVARSRSRIVGWRTRGQCRLRAGDMAYDLVIDIENTPGALARVAAAISDAGVNIAAATCIGTGEQAELHILVPHPEAAKHSLAISHLAVTREREVVVVDVEDRPGVLADLTRRIARAGVDLDLVYVATRNRVVFGAADLPALRAALELEPVI